MSLTIKQAFEALSDACANGMKNPFFVMRRLKESFADVASKVEAGGDKVTVTQTLTEGTEIGSIKVNNTTTELYAPASVHEYSTNEQIVGKWIDGSDIAEKTITGLSVATSGASWVTVAALSDAVATLDVKIYKILDDNLSALPVAEHGIYNGSLRVSLPSSTFSGTITTAIVQYIKT